MKLLICGGGNGAHVMAGLAANEPNTEARVLTLFRDEAERWTNKMKEGTFTAIFSEQGKEVRKIEKNPSIVSKDPKVAEGCDIIVLVVPAFGHNQYLTAIKPYVSPGTTIVGMPGQPGFEFEVWGVLGEKAPECTVMSFETLPWACRIKEYGIAVNALGTKAALAGSIQPGKVKTTVDDPVAALQRVMGEHPVLQMKGHILGMTLMGVNAYSHPAIVYGQFKDFKDGDSFDKAPLFYTYDEFTATTMSAMSDEVLAVAAAIMKKYPDVDLSNVIHILPFLLKAYPDDIKDKSSLQAADASNQAYQGLTHAMKPVSEGASKLVPDWGYRYFTEDIPYGLVVLRGIAEVVGVPVPVTDKVLEWAQQKMVKSYLVGGKISGPDVGGTRAPQRYNLVSIDAMLGR